MPDDAPLFHKCRSAARLIRHALFRRRAILPFYAIHTPRRQPLSLRYLPHATYAASLFFAVAAFDTFN